jgi:hypothetical protein
MNKTTSPAKLAIRTFESLLKVANESIAKGFFKSAAGKIPTLERNIATIHKKDPSFDTTEYEQAVSKLKQDVGAGKDGKAAAKIASREKLDNKVSSQKALSEFVSANMVSPELAKRVINAEKNFSGFDNYEEQIVFRTETVDRNINRFRANFADQTNSEYVVDAFESFESEKLFWETSNKILPRNTSISEANQKFQILANEIGSLSELQSQVNVQRGVKLANKKMPAAVIHDSGIEKLFRDAFSAESKNTNWDRTLMKVHITDSNWTVIRKEFTGVIVGRKHFAAIVFKDNATGNCKLYINYHIYQQHNGSGFSNFTTGKSNMASDDFLCENVN